MRTPGTTRGVSRLDALLGLRVEKMHRRGRISERDHAPTLRQSAGRSARHERNAVAGQIQEYLVAYRLDDLELRLECGRHAGRFGDRPQILGPDTCDDRLVDLWRKPDQIVA